MHKLKEKYGDKLAVTWKSFPLIIGEQKNRRFNAHAEEAWEKAGALAPELKFRKWVKKIPMPVSSLPALEAAGCAALQETALYEKYHMCLFKAYFTDRKDISKREILIDAARESGLDAVRLTAEYDAHRLKDQVIREYNEGLNRGIGSIPTLIFNDKSDEPVRLIGVSSEEQYSRLVDWFLAT